MQIARQVEDLRRGSVISDVRVQWRVPRGGEIFSVPPSVLLNCRLVGGDYGHYWLRFVLVRASSRDQMMMLRRTEW
jgi:hypothetical protein